MPQITLSDLTSIEGNRSIDRTFLKFLSENNSNLYDLILKHRDNELKIEQDILMDLAKLLQEFILDMFEIDAQYQERITEYNKTYDIFKIRREFIQRYALQKYQIQDDSIVNLLHNEYNVLKFSDQQFAKLVNNATLSKDQKRLQALGMYASWAVQSIEGINLYESSYLFNPPRKISTINEHNNLKQFTKPISRKTSFGEKYDFEDTKICGESNYCIHCHKTKKDSCRTGIDNEKSGCPLDQKISEMNLLLSDGHIIAALAVAMIDNPMIIVTGHRICNDCSRACIFQKQDAVDIPYLESGMVKFVLDLSYGFEIYALLTRWNPLKTINYIPKTPNGKRAVVVGTGPAGFSMIYYLLHSGYTTVAIDGIIIDDQKIAYHNLIIDHRSIEFDTYGFGGVMEYGITDRWNKKILLLIKILLERYQLFQLIAGVKWDSAINPKIAFSLGFDIVALAIGTSPKIPNISNITSRGVIFASDFLMHLHLSNIKNGNFQSSSMKINWPIIVIGSGLTAIDVATQLLPFYKNQEKLENSVCNSIQPIKIVSRYRMIDSQAYKINKKEVEYALQNGIEWVENFDTSEILLDNNIVSGVLDSNGQIIEAKTIIIAVGSNAHLSSIIDSSIISIYQDQISLQADKVTAFSDESHAVVVLGDINPNYRGSVVKAIASAKQAINALNGKYKCDLDVNSETEMDFISCITTQLTPQISSCASVNGGYIVKIVSPLSASVTNIGHIFMLKQKANWYERGTPVTVIETNQIDKTITIFLTQTAENDKLLSFGRIIFMGPLGTESIIEPSENILIIINSLRGSYYALSLSQIIAKKNGTSKIIMCSNNSRDLNQENHNIVNTNVDDIGAIIENLELKLQKCLIIGNNDFMLSIRDIIKKTTHQNITIVHQIETRMQCMLDGVCGRCVVKVGDKFIFACGRQEVEIH